MLSKRHKSLIKVVGVLLVHLRRQTMAAAIPSTISDQERLKLLHSPPILIIPADVDLLILPEIVIPVEMDLPAESMLTEDPEIFESRTSEEQQFKEDREIKRQQDHQSLNYIEAANLGLLIDDVLEEVQSVLDESLATESKLWKRHLITGPSFDNCPSGTRWVRNECRDVLYLDDED